MKRISHVAERFTEAGFARNLLLPGLCKCHSEFSPRMSYTHNDSSEFSLNPHDLWAVHNCTPDSMYCFMQTSGPVS